MFYSRSLMLVLVTFGLGSLLVACGGAGALALDHTSWNLATLNGNPALPNSNVTLSFDQGEFKGSGGCNSYGGKYTATSGGQLTFAETNATLMACADDKVMQQEAAYFKALNEAHGYRMNGKQLEISNPAGQTVVVLTGVN